tara:strand:+ start:891 stop:1871 length:981 start_codon:yes stop_codon:yes gene_type:complete
MIALEDIITCKSYHDLCDFRYDAPNLDDIPPTGVVQVPLDQIENFFQRIEGNGHRYIVVSSCSDYGLAHQKEHSVWQDMSKWITMQVGPGLGYSNLDKQPARCNLKLCNLNDAYSVKCHAFTRATFHHIPENVHHWFVTNLMIKDDPRMTALPFGIAEGKAELLHGLLKSNDGSKRTNDTYISWQDYTYERYQLRRELEIHPGFTVRDPQKADSYFEYLQHLGTHGYVVSPPGNGCDCYRTLEAIYMGAVVLVENTITNKLLGLPTLRYTSQQDILEWTKQEPASHVPIENRLLHDKNKHTVVGDASKIKLSYWKERFLEKRGEII